MNTNEPIGMQHTGEAQGKREEFFTWEDFSRSEFQNKFGEEAMWFYRRLAGIANVQIAPLLEENARLSADNTSMTSRLENSYIANQKLRAECDELRALLKEARNGLSDAMAVMPCPNAEQLRDLIDEALNGK